jgi:hypothetical protein
MMSAMRQRTHRAPILLLLGCVLLLACSGAGSKRRDKAPSESYFDEDPSNPTVGDVPPLGMDTIIEAHNRKRKRHCAPPLEWSGEIADVAQGWADKLAAKGCSLEHNRSSSYGENLASGSESAMGAQGAVDSWYEEVEHHQFGSKEGSKKAGHFTQLVWRDSRRLGCGTAKCNGKQIWVCNYDPPGNVKGEYDDEVLPTKCR